MTARYGLHVVPRFDEEVGLKAAVKKPPPNLKALQIWDSPAMLQLRASQQEIETQQELTLRQQELDQVLGRIAHETGVPRQAVRTAITQVAGRLGTGIATRFMNNFARRQPPPPPQAPQEAPQMLVGPPVEPEPIVVQGRWAPQEQALARREPQGNLLLGPRNPVPGEWRPHERPGALLLGNRALEEAWPELRPPRFHFGEQYALQQGQMRALEDAVQMQALAVGRAIEDRRNEQLIWPAPGDFADAIHAAAVEPLALENGQPAIEYNIATPRSSASSRRSRGGRSLDQHNVSSSGTSGSSSRGSSSTGSSSSGGPPPRALQMAIDMLRPTTDATVSAQAHNLLRGLAAPVMLPSAAAASAVQSLIERFEGARSEGASNEARRRLRQKTPRPAAFGAAPAGEAASSSSDPRRRLRGKQPRPPAFG